MAQSVIRRIERNLTASAGLQSRPTDKASIRGIHQGQRSCETAQKGRTHDCKRPLLITQKTLANRGPSTHEAESVVSCCEAVDLGRNAMEWFTGKTSIAGNPISNWVLVLAAVVVIWLIYSFAAR